MATLSHPGALSPLPPALRLTVAGDWLQVPAEGAILRAEGRDRGPDTPSLVLDVLTQYDAPDPGRASALYEAREAMPLAGKALLLHAMAIAGADATEVSMTADERKLLPAAREVGTQRPRTALCVLPDGAVLIAHASFDTDEATTEALLDAGCERVVALDRGAHDGVFVHRAGGDRAPEATYDATAIYVLPAAGTGTATEIK